MHRAALLVLGMTLVGGPAQAGALDMSDHPRAVQTFFNDLSKDTLHLVDEFYDAEVAFQDPVHQVHGRQAIKTYYGRLYENAQSVRFDFGPTVSQDDTVVQPWTMVLITESLNDGNEIRVDGVSVIRFGGAEGKAVYHRDYFDMGEFVYERIPVLRWVILKIKKKLAGG